MHLGELVVVAALLAAVALALRSLWRSHRDGGCSCGGSCGSCGGCCSRRPDDKA